MAKPKRSRNRPLSDAEFDSSEPLFDNGLFDTPQSAKGGGEADPDRFDMPDNETDADPELEALFAAVVADEDDSGLDELFEHCDDPVPDIEALFADDPESEAPADTKIESAVAGAEEELVEAEELEKAIEAAIDEDKEAPKGLEPLGEDFDSLFDDMPGEDADPDDALSVVAASTAVASRAGTDVANVSQREGTPVLRKPHQDKLDRAIWRTTPSKGRRWRPRLIWLAILAALTYIAFLPYNFEVGGEFTVQSGEISQVRARTDGEIIKVNVNDGEWVEQEQVMAVLSNWDEKREIARRESELARLQADLQTLLDGSRPEEISLKEQELASAELKVQFASTELERFEKLFSAGTIAQTALDEKRDALLLAQSEREEAKIALDLVKSGARESDVAAARAEIAGISQELDFARLQLEQTFIRAVTNGQIVSDLSTVPVGAYLGEGGLFAELEDNRVVFAHIDVPETQIDEVIEGAEVELRLWADSNARLTGTVFRVAPKAEERDFGKVIRVTVQVPNEDGRLSSGMTGFAKVAAEERPVWQAFSRMILAFFQIELWSWLP